MHHLIQLHSKDFFSCNAHDSTAMALFTDVHSCICNVLIIRVSERMWRGAGGKKKKQQQVSVRTLETVHFRESRCKWHGGTALNNSDNAAFILFGGT